MQLKEEFHVPDERVFHNKKSEVYFHAQGLQQFCSRERKRYLYHRVSTKEQHLDRGIIELKEYVKKNDLKNTEFYLDKFSGKGYDRPEYNKLKKKIKTGDTLIVTEIDRFGRDKNEILKELNYYKDQEIQVQILEIPTTLMNMDNLDGNMVKLMIDTINNMLIELYATFAQAEMEKRKKRQAEGIAAKKARGEWDDYGRPRVMAIERFREEFSRVENGEIKPFDLMRELEMSESTYYRYKKEIGK